ncbi:MAG: hypothetical protein PHO26_10595 [Dehalococcoidia bacterium]|nr:hypothetical protein [Dehalococcoidia bacterium]
MEKENENNDQVKDQETTPADNVIASPDAVGTRQSAGLSQAEAENRVTELETSLKEKDTALAEAKKSLDAQAADIQSFKTSLEDAVKAYRKQAIGTNQFFTEELVTGNTIAEIDASVIKVKDLLGKVKSGIEEELKNVTVPAGAPGRTGPDTSDLSPREKIKTGLEKK